MSGRNRYCSECGSRLNFDRRAVHRAQALFMDRLDHHTKRNGEDFYHVRDFTPAEAEKASTDSSFLVHWGLVEKLKPGYYKITDKGKQWVAGELRVPAWKLIKRGVVKVTSEDTVSFAEAFAVPFRKEEL